MGETSEDCTGGESEASTEGHHAGRLLRLHLQCFPGAEEGRLREFMRVLSIYYEVRGIMDYPADEPAGETSG